jgi:signal transduction histidine kinase
MATDPRVVLSFAIAIALILGVAVLVSRLLRSRTRGTSIRMQVFIALALIIGAFGVGLAVLVIDRIEARATLLGAASARDEAAALSAIVAMDLEARGATLESVGARLAQSRTKIGGEPIYREARGIALLDRDMRPVFSVGPSPEDSRTVSEVAPIVVAEETRGYVRVVNPTLVIRRALEDFVPTMLVIASVLGATAAFAADVLGRAIAQPIVALTEFAARVSEGDLRAKPPEAPGREVRLLSRSIDSMRSRLEGRPFVEAFAADLSHELKNPVAAIRASAEVLADGALEEPEEAKRFVARILESTARIEALLGDLLSLARVEARGVDDAPRVDLVKLVRDAAARSNDRGTEVTVEIPRGGEVAVRGDALWLTRAIDNLLENAAQHGDGGVRVRLSREGDDIAVTVSNRGTVPKHLAPRIFRRFVTSRGDQGGTGLGLAIVRAIAEAHRGTADCVLTGPPEVEFRLRLPSL